MEVGEMAQRTRHPTRHYKEKQQCYKTNSCLRLSDNRCRLTLYMESRQSKSPPTQIERKWKLLAAGHVDGGRWNVHGAWCVAGGGEAG
jgi:hypothetical protein